MFSLRRQSEDGDLKMFLALLMVQFERGELINLKSLMVNKH